MLRSKRSPTAAISIGILFIAMGAVAVYSLAVRPTIANTSDLRSKDITPVRFTEFVCSFGDWMHIYWHLRISENGDAVYFIVDRTGPQPVFSHAQFSLSEVELSALLAKLRRENFVSLGDQYHSGMADVDWVHLSVNCQGTIKTVGSNQRVPLSLAKLFRYVRTQILERHKTEIANATPITEDEAAKLDW